MSDLISREALQEELKQYFSDGTLDSVSAKLAFNMVLRKIDNAPAIEPFERIGVICEENCGYRPQGKWIYDELLNNWKCSECGETPKTIGYVGNTDFMKEHFKFCNHCGADMRGVE